MRWPLKRRDGPRGGWSGSRGRASRVVEVPSVTGLVWRFAASGLIVLAILVATSVLLSRAVGRDAALDEARRVGRLTGVGIVQPSLGGVLDGEPTALAALNDVVGEAVLEGSLVRVKLWVPDSGGGAAIAYSDESRLIGEVYPLEEPSRQALRTGQVVAVQADLDSPENRFEASGQPLLEVWVPIEDPAGRPLLYEAYFDQRGVAEAGRRVWFAFAPLVVGSLLALQVVQVPLAWSMARRLRDGALARQNLLELSLESSSVERRRIAADLHDGVVQDLAGVSYELSAAASSTDVEALASTAAAAGRAVRSSVGALRSMLVDIYPPDLHEEGLASALEDLLARHRAAGVAVEADLDVPADLPRPVAELVYRIAQEALRNVDKHAGASRVAVRLGGGPDGLVLTVDDDGVGFDVESAVADRADGTAHFGLRLLADSARELGGRLTLSSAPGAGTAVTLEVPT